MSKLEPSEEAQGLLALDEVQLEKGQVYQIRNQSRSNKFVLVLQYLGTAFELGKRGLLFLLPSFIATAVSPPQNPKSVSLRPTSYLDGLRGLAAWSVFNTHISSTLVKHAGGGWGHAGDHQQLYKLPIIRLMYKGDFAVALFFVISGFALSIGPIAAMKKVPRDPGSSMEKLAGSILRRPLRLYIPTFASTLIVFFLVRAGWFEYIISHQGEFEKYIWGWPVEEHWPARDPSFFAQLFDLLKDNAQMLSVFTKFSDADFGVAYNGVLWTVKLEFRSSLVLYLTHAALFFMRKRARIMIAIGLIISGLSINAYDFPLFWLGYLIAENFEPIKATAQGRHYNMLKSIAFWILLILGAFVGSCPGWDISHTPSHAWLMPLTPFSYRPYARFWTTVGAAAAVYSIPKLPLMLKIYNSAPVQYMGKISFGFYLVHFWIVHIFGTMIFSCAWEITGKEGEVSSFAGFIISYAILLCMTIWVADIFWRSVDKPSVRFASFVERRLFNKQ